MKNVILVFLSQAEYNTYCDLAKIKNLKETKLFLLDLTKLSGQKIKLDPEINLDKIEPKIISNKIFFIKIIGKFIRFIFLQKEIISLLKKLLITDVVMGNDQEPENLILIKLAKRFRIKSTVFQSGLYITGEKRENYEKSIYLKRFNSFEFTIYKSFRKFLSLLKIFPERKPYGLNGADQYFFYSDFYASMFIDEGLPKSKIKIVGPTKYAYLKNKNSKNNSIVYASCLIQTAFPDSKISDQQLFRTLISSIPENYNLIIKTHPSEKLEDYKNLLSGLKGNFTILDPNIRIEPYIRKAKVLVTMISSVVYDAMFLNTLVIILDIESNYKPIFFTPLLNLKLDEFNNKKIISILSNKRIMDRFLSIQERIFNEHMGNNFLNNPSLFINNL